MLCDIVLSNGKLNIASMTLTTRDNARIKGNKSFSLKYILNDLYNKIKNIEQ